MPRCHQGASDRLRHHPPHVLVFVVFSSFQLFENSVCRCDVNASAIRKVTRHDRARVCRR